MGGWFDTLANFNPQGFALRNQGLQAENEQRQAATQQSQAVTQGQQLQNQQAQQQMRDQQIWTKALQDAQGDPNQTTKNAIQYGMSGQGVNSMLDAHLKLRKSIADAYKDEQEGDSKKYSNEVAMNTQTGQQYASLAQITDPAQRAAAIPQVQQNLARIDPSHPVPTAQQLADDGQLKTRMTQAGYYGKLLEDTAKQGEIDKNTALTKKTTQDASKEQRAQALQELSSVADPDTGKVDPQGYAQWAQAHPEIKPPSLPSDAYVADQIRSGVPIEKQPDYLIQQRLQSLKPEDIQARLDSMNLPPALKSRTQVLVGQALSLGDKKGALGVLKDASDQVGRVETQQAVAPIKVSVFNQEQGARNAANNPTADLANLVYTTGSGRKYINADDLGKNRQARAQAENQGIPVVDKGTHEMLEDLDQARMNMNYMMQRIGPKLASDPTGRLYSAPANTLAKLAQTDPDLAAIGTFRTAAIQGLRAVAGSKNFRMTAAEIQQAQDNDIPKDTDTLPVARQRLANMNAFLDNAERAHLQRDRSAVASGGNTAPPKTPGYKVGDPVTLKNGKAVKVTAVHPDGSFDAQ